MFANVRSDDGDSQITNSVRQPAVEERLIGWPPAIIYLTKQPTDSICQSGYEPDEMPVTDAMIAAGREAFVRWFRQLHLEGLFVGLPEDSDISGLSVSMFRSMISNKPDA
jgi:hypothetical protein